MRTLEREIADLQTKIAGETLKELDKQKQIDSISRSITTSTSTATLQSKQRQIQSYQQDILRIQATKVEAHRRHATKATELARKKQDLLKEENREKDKHRREQEEFRKQQLMFQREQETYRREQEDLQNKLQVDISHQKEILNTLIQQTHTAVQQSPPSELKEFDFFISHGHRG